MPTPPFKIRVEASGPLGGYIAAPPSKNYTTRLILGAALADGTSTIRKPATNDDARALVACLRQFGARIEESGGDLTITGFAGRPAAPSEPVNPGNAGAVLRLLLGTACLAEGEVRFVTDYADSLGRRPNRELVDALRTLGAEVEATGDEATLPIRIAGGPGRVRGGEVLISGARSSQFLSSLLYMTPFLAGTSHICVGESAGDSNPVLVSKPLIAQTMTALRYFGVQVSPGTGFLVFDVSGAQTASPIDRTVNADWPSSAAIMAAVAVAGGMVTIHGLRPDSQGEQRAQAMLTEMGCRFMHPRPGELIIHSKGELTATEFDGDLATDAVLALVAAACLARGTSRFTGIGNLRLKECDRIREPLEELAKLGVSARHGDDWIEIDGNPEGYAGGIEVDSRGDHRVAQLLAIVGTRCEHGLTIARAEHISKSYPEFFDDMKRIGVHLSKVDAD